MRRVPLFVVIPFLLLGLALIQQNRQAPRSSVLADAFVFPFEPDGGARPPWYTSYDVQNPYVAGHSRCFAKPISQLRHAGEDWFRPGGSAVHAVANGRVLHIVSDWDHGDAIVIQHTLPEGWQTSWGDQTLHSVYLHLDATVREGQTVLRGQVIGHVYPWDGNSHLHLELRRYGDMSPALRCPASRARWLLGPSYVDENPAAFGYLNPQEWIDTHR